MESKFKVLILSLFFVVSCGDYSQNKKSNIENVEESKLLKLGFMVYDTISLSYDKLVIYRKLVSHSPLYAKILTDTNYQKPKIFHLSENFFGSYNKSLYEASEDWIIWGNTILNNHLNKLMYGSLSQEQQKQLVIEVLKWYVETVIEEEMQLEVEENFDGIKNKNINYTVIFRGYNFDFAFMISYGLDNEISIVQLLKKNVIN